MRTPLSLALLERAVIEAGGELIQACRLAGVSLYEVNQWCMADPSVDQTIKASQRLGWMSLEQEAYRRAVHGVSEAVYHKGEVVGHKQVYSDGLLSKLLDAKLPDYSKSQSGSGVTVNVAVMPRANTYEEWLAQRVSTVTPDAVPDAVEGEYKEVSPEARAAYRLMAPPDATLPDCL